MISCTCEQPLASEVGEGFVVTLEEERRWMRRRTDLLVCSECGVSYRLVDLVSLQTSTASNSEADRSRGSNP